MLWIEYLVSGGERKNFCHETRYNHFRNSAETIAEAVHFIAKAVNEKVTKLTTCENRPTDRL